MNPRMMSILLAVTALTATAAQPQRADLSRLVVVGDSLAAGYQNGSLDGAQQVNGLATLIATQKGVALPLPLIAAPGIPNVLTLVSPGPPPVIVPAPGASAGRIDPGVQAYNLAVPGQTLDGILHEHPDFAFDDFADLVLGLPGLLGGVSKTQVEWAEALHPTTILVWAGNNDALGAAIAGDPAFLTPVNEFESSYRELLTRLSATGATLVVANIPDVSTIPYLTRAEQLADQLQLPLAVIGPILGIGPGDYVTPDAFPLIPLILTSPAAGPLPGNVVLTATEMVTLQQHIQAYNTIITEQAAAKGAALVDVFALTQQLAANGFEANGRRLTTGFLGGLFSLDGIHPTNTGHAILANEFIHALNQNFAAGIPPVSVTQIAKSDPLATLESRGHLALGTLSPATAQSLKATLAHGKGSH